MNNNDKLYLAALIIWFAIILYIFTYQLNYNHITILITIGAFIITFIVLYKLNKNNIPKTTLTFIIWGTIGLLFGLYIYGNSNSNSNGNKPMTIIEKMETIKNNNTNQVIPENTKGDKHMDKHNNDIEDDIKKDKMLEQFNNLLHISPMNDETVNGIRSLFFPLIKLN